MDDHRTLVPRLEGGLLPYELLGGALGGSSVSSSSRGVGSLCVCGLLLLLLLLLCGGGDVLFFFGGNLVSLVRETESDRKLEVQLDGSALVRSFQSVPETNVDLGTVEGAVADVEGPGLSGFLQSLLQGCLCLVPQRVVSELVLRTGGQLQLVLETKNRIDEEEEVEGCDHLSLHLLHHTEDVRVVLLESSDPGEAGEGAGDFVPVQYSEICHTNRELPVRGVHVSEHDAVPRTVHGFQPPLCPLHVETIHVILVLLIVT
mmetsp:Transcript_8998/g.17596  ORF Transcript_8998/g.17596 Transcript_8998/m.17596 type:complete len:260 (+) Transcript_8998:540-1319(+)